MRYLPPLLVGSHCWTLPLADRSAVFLVNRLLQPGREDPDPDCLRLDPPLLLWTACRAWAMDGFRPRSVDLLVDWLLKNAVHSLRWPNADLGCPPALSADLVDRFAVLVASDLVVAEVAFVQAGEEVAEEAKLLGMLAGAGTWFEMVAPGRDCSTLLPEWLPASESTLAGRHAAAAVGIVRAGSEPAQADFDIEARREWAGQQAGRWSKEISDVPSLLPALMSKLGRLADLEQKFSETLEAEKLESLAEFAAGAGHEINNPLAIIGGRSQLLLRDETCPERQRELALIVAQVRRANEMIADMRLFSRPPEPEPEKINLVELVSRTIDEFAEQASERAIQLLTTGETDPVEIEADPVQLAVVFHALVRNALEAIGREGAVEISVRRTPMGAEVSVVDDGPGILSEERRHLFDPFYSARQAGRGLGFGLSKAWRIVTNHGGQILVESEPGEGAAFMVRLPRRIAGRNRRE